MSIAARFAVVFALAFAACAPLPNAPVRLVEEAAIGNPSETDTECTSTRLANGMCDFVVAHAQHLGTVTPGLVTDWYGSPVMGYSPPTIYERGTQTGSPNTRTIRLWAYDLRQLWQGVCGSTSGTCGVVAHYAEADEEYPLVIAVSLGRLENSNTWLFHATYQISGTSTAGVADTFAVAYDTSVGAYGVTGAARRMQPQAATSTVPAHQLLDSGGGLFSASYPTWTAD